MHCSRAHLLTSKASQLENGSTAYTHRERRQLENIMQPRAHRTGSRGVTIPKKCINNQLTKLKVYRIVNNCNWCICIALPTKRLRAHRRAIISLYPGVHRQTGTKMSSADDKKRGSIAAASTLSAASSMHAVRQRKKPVRQFVNTCMGR